MSEHIVNMKDFDVSQTGINNDCFIDSMDMVIDRKTKRCFFTSNKKNDYFFGFQHLDYLLSVNFSIHYKPLKMESEDVTQL
jgi:hypothetical protein